MRTCEGGIVSWVQQVHHCDWWKMTGPVVNPNKTPPFAVCSHVCWCFAQLLLAINNNFYLSHWISELNVKINCWHLWRGRIWKTIPIPCRPLIFRSLAYLRPLAGLLRSPTSFSISFGFTTHSTAPMRTCSQAMQVGACHSNFSREQKLFRWFLKTIPEFLPVHVFAAEHEVQIIATVLKLKCLDRRLFDEVMS